MYNVDIINSTNNTNDWVGEYRKEKLKAFNELPIPFWKRVKIGQLSLPEYQAYHKPFIEPLQEEGIILEEILKEEENIGEFRGYFSVGSSFGVSEKFVTLGEALYNAGFLLRVNRNMKPQNLVRINYQLDEENPLVMDHNIIIAEENSEVTVVIDYSSETTANNNGYHNGVTKVFAKDGAKINIIKIQRLGKDAINIDSNIAIVGGNGEVNWTLIDIGGDVNVVNYMNNLEGDESQSNLKSIYFGDGDSKLDLSYTMNHIGVRSLSKIETRGALKDKAKKVFRGNLDFKKGSRKSKGDEGEYVLLLDKNVSSHSIPVLFSHEDDVEGNHAASAGQIDGNQLFYLMSRGFTEKEAKKLIVEASFRHIIDDIPIVELRDSVNEEIHRRLVYE